MSWFIKPWICAAVAVIHSGCNNKGGNESSEGSSLNFRSTDPVVMFPQHEVGMFPNREDPAAKGVRRNRAPRDDHVLRPIEQDTDYSLLTEAEQRKVYDALFANADIDFEDWRQAIMDEAARNKRVQQPIIDDQPHKPYNEPNQPHKPYKEPYQPGKPYTPYKPYEPPKTGNTLEDINLKLKAVDFSTVSPSDAWKTIGGPELVKAVREHQDNGWSSENIFQKAVKPLFFASELMAVSSADGLSTPFEKEDKEYLCEKLKDTVFRKELSKSIATRLYDRGQRQGSYDYVGSGWMAPSLTGAARHPLANLAKFCDIPEKDFDLKFYILNQKIGRLIKTAISDTLDWQLGYFVDASTNLDINEILTEFPKKGYKTWLYGPRGNAGKVRDWFTNIYLKMLKPESGLFEVSATGIYSLSMKSIDDEKKSLYKGIGMVLASALVEGYSLGVEFSRLFYEVLLHKVDVTKLDRKDLELNDPQFFNCWKYGADCDTEDGVSCEDAIEDAFEDTNMVSSDGKRELVENGRNIPITVHNIKQYSKLLLVDYLYDRHAPQYELISAGFDEMLSRDIFDFVSVEDLKEFLRGKTDLSAEELKEAIRWPSNRAYAVGKQGYIWLNELFESEGQAFRNGFIKFATSLSTPPLGGFVENSKGEGKIQLDYSDKRVHTTWDSKRVIPLPNSHTCYYQVFMVEYESKDQLREKLNEAYKNLSFAYDDVEADLVKDDDSKSKPVESD